MSTQVRLPDGRTITVASDDPKQAAAAARAYWTRQGGAAQPQARQPRRTVPAWVPPVAHGLDVIQGAAGSILDGVLPNWGDEVYAAPRAAAAWLRGDDTNAAFVKAQREYKQRQGKFERENPKTAKAAYGTGMVAGAFVPASKAVRGASLTRQAMNAARVGAAYGALSGAGEGEGFDLATRGTNAAYSAATGAAVGAVIPPLATGAGRVVRAARMRVPGVDRAVTTLARVPQAVIRATTGRGAPVRRGPSAGEEQANRMLAQRMNQGEIATGLPHAGPQATPQAIEHEVARRSQMGVPAMIGDVTEPMRELTEWSSRGMGPGQTLVRRALESRKATEGLRVRGHVQDTLPTTADPIRFVADMKQQARAAAAPLYEQAYQQPMYRTPGIQAIEQTPAFGNSLPQARENIMNQIDPATGLPKDPRAMGFRFFDGDPAGLPPNVPHFPLPNRGYVALDQGLSTEGYDQVVRAMNDAGRGASNVNPVTGAIESTTNSVHINNRARDLRQELMDQNAPYRQAVERYGDDMTYVNSFNQGREVGNMTGHEVNAQAREIPDFARNAWSTGAGTAMADAASQYGAKYPNGDVANQVRKMLGDDVKQQAIGDITGNTGGVRNLLDRLEYEHQGHINWQGVNGNSKTAARQALDNDLNASAGIPMSKAGVVSRLVDFVGSHAIPQYQQDVKRRIAEVVTATNPQTVQEAMKAIERQAVRDRDFADALHRAGIATTATYARNIAPVDPTEEP